MNELYIVIEGGCVRFVSGNYEDQNIHVVDIDDINDSDREDRKHGLAALAKAEELPRLW